jgi:uncharacterized tellurite resistance protein B-like protein
MNLRKMFGLPEPEPGQSPETDTVRRIVEALDRMDPEQARYIAAFAYILGRVANADQHVSDEELHMMESIVMSLAKLPEEQAILVVQMAKQRNQIFGATENFLVTREFNRFAEREQKMNLLHCLFAVSAAHEEISVAEDNEIRQIASELGLEHREFIAVRSSFRDRLAVLKKPETPSA